MVAAYTCMCRASAGVVKCAAITHITQESPWKGQSRRTPCGTPHALPGLWTSSDQPAGRRDGKRVQSVWLHAEERCRGELKVMGRQCGCAKHSDATQEGDAPVLLPK